MRASRARPRPSPRWAPCVECSSGCRRRAAAGESAPPTEVTGQVARCGPAGYSSCIGSGVRGCAVERELRSRWDQARERGSRPAASGVLVRQGSGRTSTAPNNLFRVDAALARRAAAGLRRGIGLDQLDRRHTRLVGARRGPDYVRRNCPLALSGTRRNCHGARR
jgi:hypothetical protein